MTSEPKYTLPNGEEISGRDLYCRLFTIAKPPLYSHEYAEEEREEIGMLAAQARAAGYEERNQYDDYL